MAKLLSTVGKCHDPGPQANATCCQKDDGSFRFQGPGKRGFSKTSCIDARRNYYKKIGKPDPAEAGKTIFQTGVEDLDRLSRGEKPSDVGTTDAPGGGGPGALGGGTGKSPNCEGCNAGDVGCEFGKFSCELTNWIGDSLPMVAIGVGAIIVLIIALK